ADAAGLKNLTHLNVARNLFSPDGLRALLQNVGLKRLTYLHLNVYGNGEGFWRVTPAEPLRGRLELRAEFWDDVRWTELDDSPLLAACAALTLAGGRSGDQTAQALAATKGAGGLVALELLHSDVHDAGASALATSSVFTMLRRLSLAGHRMTKAGYLALLHGSLIRQLTHLDLSSWTLSEEVLKAVAEA